MTCGFLLLVRYVRIFIVFVQKTGLCQPQHAPHGPWAIDYFMASACHSTQSTDSGHMSHLAQSESVVYHNTADPIPCRPRIEIFTTLLFMMTSSNGNIFSVTGHLCGEFTGPRWIPHTKASDAELWCFFDLCLNKRLRKQSRGWWFETLSWPLWRHRNIVAPAVKHHINLNCMLVLDVAAATFKAFSLV